MPPKNRPARRQAKLDRSSERPADVTPLLKPETRHGIMIVILLTLGPVLLLSVLGWAGAFGDAMADGLGTLFGWQRYLIWLYLSGLGLLLLFPERFHLATSRWIGFLVALAAAAGLLQMFLPYDTAVQEAVAGEGGGYLGALVSQSLRSSFGPWATGIILVGLFLVGLLVMFNTTLRTLLAQRHWPARWLARWKARRWEKRLAAGQTVTENDATPDFEHRDLEPAEGETTSDEQPTDETEYVPLPPKPAKRQRRTITIPIDLLDLSTGQPTSGNIEANKDKIKRTLETFGIPVEMDEVNVGPTVTQYTLRPAEGVKLSQITSLNNDLALALAAHPIRIEAPIPGKALVGIEVPNESVAIVQLRDILDSPEFKARRSNLTFSLGKDVSGRPWVSDLDPLPHLLVAGATGSGKSVMINSLIISLLYSNSPDDLKLILVDPKRVELSLYNGTPHLMTPVISDSTKTINALRWVVAEMDRRYQVLQNAGKRNIASYRREVNDDLAYIVVIIDELADLMAVAANEVEGAIVRLAQMARAVGIHLVLATQRPSVDVITGLIKANVTARIAFSVASQVDSRTILDSSGAEKLLGKGDMLFVSAELSKPKRLQGSYVSEKEVERVVQFLKTRGQPEYMTEVVETPAPVIGGSLEDLGDDELLSQAKEVILQAGKASASLLQRRLRIGYARAARILDLLEEEGFIGPGEGAKPREVFGQSVAPMETTADTLPTSDTTGTMGGEAVDENSDEPPPA